MSRKDPAVILGLPETQKDRRLELSGFIQLDCHLSSPFAESLSLPRLSP